MTIAIDLDTITRTTDRDCDSGGAQRDVWFAGDLVIKRDGDGWSNKSEFENYKAIVEFAERFPERMVLKIKGREVTVKVPETTMVGEYIVMQKVEGEHVPFYLECTKCGGRDYDTHWYNCFVSRLEQEVDGFASREFGVIDMHRANWLWDEANSIAWLVDLGM